MVALVLAAAVSAFQGAEQAPPAPIEQAVIEHRCLGTRTGATVSGDPYHDCLAAQLLILRSDFGTDLKKLTTVERRKLDAVCSRIRSVEGRERYVACLSDRLAALHGERLAPVSNAAVPVPAEAAAAPAPVTPPTPPPGRSSRGLIVIAIAVGVVGTAGGGAYLFLRRPPKRPACRTCGAIFEEPGDLCPACRHEAAEALRRAAVEREEQARALKEQERRQVAEESELRRLRALEEETLRRRLEEERLRSEEMQRLEQERRRREEAEERHRFGSDAADASDPHDILGVRPGASADELRSAYDEARAKYDPDLVSHLSAEVQAHYRAKADAVDRAYRALSQPA